MAPETVHRRNNLNLWSKRSKDSLLIINISNSLLQIHILIRVQPRLLINNQLTLRSLWVIWVQVTVLSKCWFSRTEWVSNLIRCWWWCLDRALIWMETLWPRPLLMADSSPSRKANWISRTRSTTAASLICSRERQATPINHSKRLLLRTIKDWVARIDKALKS